MLRRRLPFVVACVLLGSVAIGARQGKRPPFVPADIDDLATLLKIEDTRTLDVPALQRILKSTQPEVRRRAVQTLGRVLTPEGAPLLEPLRADADPEIVGTVAFAYGQRKDADAVAWLAAVMSDAKTNVDVAREAARSLGKIKSPEARAALAAFLTTEPTTKERVAVVEEALLSLGRFTGRADLTALTRWTTSADPEVRWRATWALYRPRDVAGLPALLKLSADSSADVRLWAMRGLGIPPPPAPGRGNAAPATPPPPPWVMSDADRAAAAARLRAGVKDADRRVRTEALRALATYDDDASFAVVLASLDSPDPWIAGSAAELMTRFTSRASVIVPKLVAVTAPGKPTALRIIALAPLTALGPSAAIDLAVSLLNDANPYARTQAATALSRRLGPDGIARLDAAVAADPKLAPLVAPAGPRPPAPARATRTDVEYRQLVEKWIVPAYNGAAAPHVVFDTPRGPIEIELHTGDAPFGTEYLMSVISNGTIVGTEFTRVVPDFVDQEAGIPNRIAPLRDEVTRRGLLRGNLSWASGGLDTGVPGYTLGNAPQPHNEGDFTALGTVIKGADAMDHIELGDAITGARVIR
jgi:HEAT repeat protein/cyclophilin family peptidyl-prolyl cis-trans isomerase